jgi:hypothetical protein
MAFIPRPSGKCCTTAVGCRVRNRSPLPVGPLRRCWQRSAGNKGILEFPRTTKRKKEIEPAGAGASAFAPRGTTHAYQNFRDEAAHILVMVTPAGLDQFFEDATAQNKGLSQPDFARVEQLMQSYGVELLAPPLS